MIESATDGRWRRAWRRLATQAAGVEARWLIVGGLGLAALLAGAVVKHEGLAGRTWLEGVVTLNGRPVKGAKVWLEESRRCHTETDGLGAFSLHGLPSGPRTVLVEGGGYSVGYPLQIPAKGTLSIGNLPLYDPDAPPSGPDTAARVMPDESLRVIN